MPIEVQSEYLIVQATKMYHKKLEKYFFRKKAQ